METNYEHFFSKDMVLDTVTLLTYDTHPRVECRRFKAKIKGMSASQFKKWLDEQHNMKEFNW